MIVKLIEFRLVSDFNKIIFIVYVEGDVDVLKAHWLGKVFISDYEPVINSMGYNLLLLLRYISKLSYEN